MSVYFTLAEQANFSSWQQAKVEILRIVDALSQWSEIADELGVSQKNKKMISSQFNSLWRDNKHLCV